MSNKKFRKPPEGAQEAYEKRQEDASTSTHPPARTPAEICDGFLDNATPETLREYVEEGWQIFHKLHATCEGPGAAHGALTDEEVEHTLASCVRFLHQVVYLTGCVVQTVDAKQLRRIVAPGMKLPDSARLYLKAAGIDIEEAPAEEASDVPQREDHRKRPRGRKHPLLVLFNLSVQASRLIDKITRQTNPHAHNKETLQERQLNRTMGDAERLFRIT